MYIIKTHKDEVHIDFDELQRLAEEVEKGTKLIFFRPGVVNPVNIVTVVEDTERKAGIRKKVGETDEQRLERLKEIRSDDLFEHLRANNNKLLS